MHLTRDVAFRSESERRFAAQFAVARILAESSHLAEAGPRVLEALCAHFDWPVGGLWLVEPPAQVLRCVDLYLAAGLRAPEFVALTREAALGRAAGVPGRVWLSGSPVWVADLAQDPNPPRGAVALKEGLRSAWGFPILAGEEVVGVLEFFCHEVRKPDAALLAMMTDMGHLLGHCVARWQAEEALRESEEKFRTVADTIPCSLFIARGDRFLYVNRTAERSTGYSHAELMAKKVWELTAPEVRGLVRERVAARRRGERPPSRYETKLLTKAGEVRWTDASLSVLEFGGAPALLGLAFDIEDRKRAESLAAGQATLLRQVASGVELKEVLGLLCRFIEQHSHRTLSSVLLLDRDTGRLRLGAAPSLPDSYNRAVDGLPIGAAAGSCGTAAFLGRPVIVSDIAVDPLWDGHQAVAMDHGLRACWSTPILSSAGAVLGTFAMYYGEPRSPSARDEELVAMATHIAAVAIEHSRGEEALRKSEQGLRQLSARLLRLQDDERRRLARELHDSVGQALAAVAINLDTLGRAEPALAASARSVLEESRSLAAQCLSEIRTLAYLLHPPLLDEAGLESALRWYRDGLAVRSGLEIELDLPQGLGRLPSELETTAFRIVQECLTNIHRHSGSRRAVLRVTRGAGEVTVVVQDEGRGMAPDVLRGAQEGIAGLGVGLAGMRERVRQLGGRLTIDSSSAGTVVRATLPLGTAS